MSTRSVVGKTIKRKGGVLGFKGRYVHSDGYPTGRGPVLFDIVNDSFMGNVELALRVLTEDWFGWSCLNPDEGTKESWSVKAGYSTLKGLSQMNADGRFALVPRVGIAYTTETGGVGQYPQSKSSDWHTEKDADCFLEWAYGIDAKARTLTVWEGAVKLNPDGTRCNAAYGTPEYDAGTYTFAEIGTYSFDEPQPDWGRVECGENLERCGHVEGYHDRKDDA